MGMLVDLIRQLNVALGITSLLVSHDIHETVSIADQIYIIAEGKVIGAGSPEELRDGSTPMVKQFMHGDKEGPVPFHYPADDLAFDLLGEG